MPAVHGRGALHLNAASCDGRRRLSLSLAAAPSSFGAPIPVPTPQGFSAQPGCRESYAATLQLAAYA